MSKKDYELVASAINAAHVTCREGYVALSEKDLSDVFWAVRSALTSAFEDDNKRFDAKKFIEACTPKS